LFLFLLPALFFGWSLGANDAANIFGTAVSSKIVKYSTAIWLSAVFIVLGAYLQGGRGMETIRQVSAGSMLEGSISVLAAAITMSVMTWIKAPVSSSQAIIGAIIGLDLFYGRSVQWDVLWKVFAAWVGTPLGGALFGFLGYKLLSVPFKKLNSVVLQDRFLKIGIVIIGSYGAYSLGANNVANITGVFAQNLGISAATLIGGFSIALGVLTFSKRVMSTVGHDIVVLDHFSAAVAVLGESITVWIYALIGIPVSTSQAIVGAVIGAGLARGVDQVNKKTLGKIAVAWVNTPISAGIVAVLLALLFRGMGVKP